MSAMELRNFESQLDLLSYAEQLAIMEYLVKLMKRRQEESVSDAFEGDVQARNGLDEAIAQVERGEVEVFDTFEDFKAAMAND